MENGLRQVLFYPAEVSLARQDSISQLRAKLVLFPPGSRLAETSKVEDAGLAPKESAIETLCRWTMMADSAKGFVFLPHSFGEASVVEARGSRNATTPGRFCPASL